MNTFANHFGARTRFSIAGFLCSAFLSVGSHAFDLPLDSAFGDSGRARVFAGWSAGESIYSVRALSAGGYFLAGSNIVPETYNTSGYLAAIKLSADGLPDGGWGFSGRLDVPLTGSLSSSADGENSMTYFSGSVESKGAIIRVGSNGQLDRLFATGGVWSDATMSDYTVLTSPSTVGSVTGIALTQLSTQLRIVKLTSVGVPDVPFGGAHNVPTPGFSGTKNLKAAVLDNAGRLLAVINHTDATTNAVAAIFVRIGTDGLLDSSFGTGGVMPVNGAYVTGSTLQSNNDILVTFCPSTLNATSGCFVRRYTSSGDVVSSYGTLPLPLAPTDHYFQRAVFVDTLGATFLNVFVNGTPSRAARVRVLSDGSIDTAFGQNGFAYVTAQSNQTALLPVLSDRISIVVGRGNYTNDPNTIMRFKPDGALDITFGANGIAQLSFGRPFSRIFRTLRVGSGKYVVIGSTARQSDDGNYGESGIVARLLANGARDDTFGQFGTVFVDFVPSALDITDDEKLLVGGGNKVVRLTASGAPDLSFGSQGQATLGANAFVRDLLVDKKSRIVVAGSTPPGGIQSAAFATRLMPDGVVDPSFDGVLVPNRLGAINRIAPFGTGYYFAGTFGGFVLQAEYGLLTRVMESGAADATFVPNTSLPPGVSLAPGSVLLPRWLGGASSLALDSMGRVIVGSGRASQLARLTSSGAVDLSFGVSGYASVPTPGAVMLTRDQRVVVATGFRGSSTGQSASQSLVVLDTKGSSTLASAPTDAILSSPIGYAPVEPWTGLSIDAKGTSVFGGTHGVNATLVKVDIGSSKCWLDIDGDGAVTANVDGKLIIDYLRGIRTPAILASGISLGATVWRSHALLDSLEALTDAGNLDLDGDGGVSASSDGLVLVRILLGYQGDGATDGAISPVAPRATYAEIKRYLSDACGLSN